MKKKRLKFIKEIDGYSVQTKGEILGYIGWDKDWKTYVFAPFGDTKFCSNCLMEIKDFMESCHE